MANQNFFPHWKTNLTKLINGKKVGSLYYSQEGTEVKTVTDPQTKTTKITITPKQF